MTTSNHLQPHCFHQHCHRLHQLLRKLAVNIRKINNSSEIGQMTLSIDSSLVSMTTGYSSSPASITTGNSNSSSVPMSSANGSSSSAPTITATSTESVQLLLSSFVGIFAVSLIFLMTFCICKAIKRRRGSTTVHEQQKSKYLLWELCSYKSLQLCPVELTIVKNLQLCCAELSLYCSTTTDVCVNNKCLMVRKNMYEYSS